MHRNTVRILIQNLSMVVRPFFIFILNLHETVGEKIKMSTVIIGIPIGPL